MRLTTCDRPRMAVYVWQQELDPEFPLAVLEYATQGDGDRMHWHDHLEIAVVLEGRGAFLFGRRALPAEVGDIFFIDNSQPHVALADPAAASWTLATSRRSGSTSARPRPASAGGRRSPRR
jgi:quercetin dioxygenase-like cupin family protein